MNIMLFSLLLYSGTFDVADSEMLPKFYWLLGIFATVLLLSLNRTVSINQAPCRPCQNSFGPYLSSLGFLDQ